MPSNWQKLAIAAAKAKLETCAKANTLNLTNCPQHLDQPEGPSSTTEAVHWTLINEPLAHAVPVPATVPSDTGGLTGQVAVYGLYQMEVSYTTTGQAIRPYLDYTGGLAGATMTWDGTSFQNVQLTPTSGAQLPSGVSVAPFARPTDVTDATALAAVKAGFAECVSLKMPLTAPGVPNCPQSRAGLDVYTVSAQWILNGDPMQGALVSFDTEHGDFTVTGGFDMTLNSVVNYAPNPGYGGNGPHTQRSNGNYTATLAWDGRQLTLARIARG